MGQAIQEAIMESVEEGSYHEETTLSAEHQLIMTWCWINIKVRQGKGDVIHKGVRFWINIKVTVKRGITNTCK